MRTLLLAALIGAIVFLAYQNHTKEQMLRQFAAAEEEAEIDKKIASLKDTARKADAEREALRRKLAIADQELARARDETANTIAARDDARRQVEAANAEIARLTSTTPKPVTWFQKRLDDASNKLEATPMPPGGMRPRYSVSFSQ